MEELFAYLKNHLHIDPYIALIVIASGFFSKRYLAGFFLAKDTKTDDAYKTLLVSSVVSLLYLYLVGITKEEWANYLISYFFATSFYELILRPITKGITKIFNSEEKDSTNP